MIRINLLPAQAEATQTKIHPAIFIVGMAVVLAVFLVPLSWSELAKRSRLNAEATSLQSELARYQPIIAQVEALEQAKGQLQQRKSLIQQLENERLRYPQFMEDLLKLLPNNVWLTNLTTLIQPDGTTLNVSMDVIALDHYAIADLVSNFETSQIFSDVDLGTLALSQSQTGQSINVHVTTVYKKKQDLLSMPLKNRNTIIALAATVLISAGILYAYTTLFYTPIRKDIVKAKTTIDDLQEKLKVARARAQQLTQMQQEMATLQVDVADLEKELPKNRELPSLIRVLTRRAENFGITVGTLAPGKPTSKGLYDETPYNVTVTASFHTLARFLTAMGKGDRLFAARNLAVTANGSKTDATKTINATFQLIAFKYHG